MTPSGSRSAPTYGRTDGSGGAIPTDNTLVIPFSRADRRRKIARVQIPDHCGNGHRLTVGMSESTSGSTDGDAGSVVTTAPRDLGIGNGQAECARIVRSM